MTRFGKGVGLPQAGQAGGGGHPLPGGKIIWGKGTDGKKIRKF